MINLELPDLPYSKDALAPYMSAETLELHHDKHHMAYVTNGNKFIKDAADSLDENGIFIAQLMCLKSMIEKNDLGNISHEHIETPHSVLNVNDQMKVMIIDLDAERGRISLSTKALEPEPGDMLTDPQKVFDKAEEMAARYKQMLLEQAEEGEDPNAVIMA